MVTFSGATLVAIGRAAGKLWAGLDGPNAQKVTRLAIFAILIVLAVGGYLTLGWFDHFDKRLGGVEVKVGGIPGLVEVRNKEVADMKRRDDEEDRSIREHDRLIATIARELRALSDMTADLKGQVTVITGEMFGHRSTVPEVFRKERP